MGAGGEGDGGKRSTPRRMREKDFEKVLMALSRTREEEIGCDECFERLERFVEMEL